MTADEIRRVQAGFAEIASIAADPFHARPFEPATEGRPLFHGDMAAQKRKPMAMRVTVVASLGRLDRLDRLIPAARELVRRHVGYDVRPAHHGPVVPR